LFFHVDESGNSGNNLFDPNQPVLSYGVLSSKTNVDALGIKTHAAILRKVGAESLHANELREEGLTEIAGELVALQQRLNFRFDYYFIHKPSFAVTTLFNAVFDAGINKAMKWDWYWTPMRFPLVASLDYIVDEEILRESWRLCLIPRDKVKAEGDQISALLSRVLERLEASEIDLRMNEVMRDALLFGIRNPLEMDFGIYSPTALSPNSIGFQFVLTAIARRQKLAGRKALGITVDRQAQFNKAQLRTYDIQSKLATALRASRRDRVRYLAHPFLEGVRGDAAALISHFPEEKVTIAPSEKSVGLQITDAYLWLTNRAMSGRAMPRELGPILEGVFKKGLIDGISIDGMMQRWKAFERKLPSLESLTPAQHAFAQQSVDRHREVIRALNL
jgi:Protein of unknown function (DUF3800)